ncbi:MAG: protein-glutamate O-methyltransferase CheR [Nitrospina sp.]|jgi:chemotaxis protein methyltransferase CheR|nr:protein-glutamate O-methyltransferase CheR [Nitrospina sp.]MBT3507946.1 protein-glutamate O-methyltransferase CheR [Nitrospina sp.]MBT3876472.1 protein-glutamate O-methyltransferase CheR [Nitrospina sp.]MBT4048707.1 protein-glutamate O-methyltransferase CheR [Nitrospina sp.]MBT4558058.1 protein-glutamate O-methyltransferase CheR [Nitrospina sp.]
METEKPIPQETADVELELLLEAIYQEYGYDYRDYIQVSLKRQILNRLEQEGLKSITELQVQILKDKDLFNKLLGDLSINVTELFRDPLFYLALKKEVLPILKTYPQLNIWHAGCATGQEVYSFAIMLKEEGLYEKTQIYATDVNQVALEKAKAGIYSLSSLKEGTANYQQAGGEKTLTDYYTTDHKNAIINRSLKKNILFCDHNLVTDKVFCEMNLIMCRNVFIYFNESLREQVLKIFHESLCRQGYLCLGAQESLLKLKYSNYFERAENKQKIFRKTIHGNI